MGAAQRMIGRVSALPAIDAHTHLVDGKLAARGLHDVLLYHMAVSDLYAAGCPSGARLTQYPGWPSTEEAHARIQEALPFLRYVRGTAIAEGIRIILRDLYGWTEEITAENWRGLDGMVRERADDRAWQREVARRAGITRFSTELARSGAGADADIFDYSLEWAFFTRCQWGEHDTALYELERCWGREPESPAPIGSGARPATERVIRSLEDVRDAVDWYVGHIPFDRVLSSATHFSTDIDYRLVSDAEMKAALARRASAGPSERDVYASYINEAFINALEPHADRIVFQFSLAAEPLPFETASRLSQRTIGQLAEIIGRHPRMRFMCHLSSLHANQSLCTLCRELPNFSLAGYWWHSFFPAMARRVMDERLDMLPTNRQVGFFSDAYCLEWTYAKSVMVRRELARVLAARVDDGRLDEETAVGIAAEILLDTPRDLMAVRRG
jgi:hypothetical protein